MGQKETKNILYYDMTFTQTQNLRDRKREYNHWDKGWRWYDSQREYRFSL